MNKKVWITVLFVWLIAAVAASALITVSFGSTQLGLREVYDIIYDHLFAGDARVNAGVYLKTHLKIVWFVRLPRTLFAMLVGAGLGICGAAMQSLVLNPIADPYVLGISSGASAGAVSVIILGWFSFLGGYAVIFGATLGAAAAICLSLSIASLKGRITSTQLVLAGIATSALFSAKLT